MGRTACTEPQCLYKGAALYLYLTVELYLYFPYGLYVLYRASVPVQGCPLPYLTVELYLYFPYGPYVLYRASVPVQGCSTLPLPYSRPIPLLPLWAVRPVQSLSACTRVSFTLPSLFNWINHKQLYFKLLLKYRCFLINNCNRTPVKSDSDPGDMDPWISVLQLFFTECHINRPWNARSTGLTYRYPPNVAFYIFFQQI
jgi:hypothetical protein